MAKYLFVYHGGSQPSSPEDVAKVIEAWGKWFENLGPAVLDPGDPVGVSTTVNSDGSVTNNGGSNPASGYSLVDAGSEEEAITLARGCPILAAGGSIELAQTIDM